VAYVAAHAVEYFVVVHHSLRRRAATGDDSAVARASATGARRLVLYAGYAATIVLLTYATYRPWDGALYRFAILFLGGMHILYDGFVWKLRRPTLARSLGVPAAGPGSA